MISQSPACVPTQVLLCLLYRAYLWQLHLPGAPSPLQAHPHPSSSKSQFSAPGLLVAASEQPSKTVGQDSGSIRTCTSPGVPWDIRVTALQGALSSPPLRRWAPQSSSTSWPSSQRRPRLPGTPAPALAPWVSALPHLGLREKEGDTWGALKRHRGRVRPFTFQSCRSFLCPPPQSDLAGGQ